MMYRFLPWCALALLSACPSEQPAAVAAVPEIVDAGIAVPEKKLSPIGGPCQEDSDCMAIAGPPWCMDRIRGLRRQFHAPDGYCTTLACPESGCGPAGKCGSLNGEGSTNCVATASSAADCDLAFEFLDGACVPKKSTGFRRRVPMDME